MSSPPCCPDVPAGSSLLIEWSSISVDPLPSVFICLSYYDVDGNYMQNNIVSGKTDVALFLSRDLPPSGSYYWNVPSDIWQTEPYASGTTQIVVTVAFNHQDWGRDIVYINVAPPAPDTDLCDRECPDCQGPYTQTVASSSISLECAPGELVTITSLKIMASEELWYDRSYFTIRTQTETSTTDVDGRKAGQNLKSP